MKTTVREYTVQSGGANPLPKRNIARNFYADLADSIAELAETFGIDVRFHSPRRLHIIKREIAAESQFTLRLNLSSSALITTEAWSDLEKVARAYSSAPANVAALVLRRHESVIEFRFIKESRLYAATERLLQIGFTSLGVRGTVDRAIKTCSLSRFSDLFDANHLAYEISRSLNVAGEPFIEIFDADAEATTHGTGNRRSATAVGIKIAIVSADQGASEGEVVADSCLDCYDCDLAIAPLFAYRKLTGFKLAFGRHFQNVLFVPEDQLTVVLAAIQGAYSAWLIDTRGSDNLSPGNFDLFLTSSTAGNWRAELETKFPGVQFEAATEPATPARQRTWGAEYRIPSPHFGWTQQPSNANWTYGLALNDSSNGSNIGAFLGAIAKKFSLQISLSGHELLFHNIVMSDRSRFEHELQLFGFGTFFFRDGYSREPVGYLSAC